MKPIMSIVQPHVTLATFAREVQSAHVALQDAERKATISDQRSILDREDAARRRLEMGRALIKAKEAARHGEWLPFLETQGIEERNARRWMDLAGYTDSKSDTSTSVSDFEVPTLREAGVDKRPRKADRDPDMPPDDEESPAPRVKKPAKSDVAELLAYRNDIDAALSSLNKTIMGYAKSWPRKSRSNLAQALRNVALAIESMSDT